MKFKKTALLILALLMILGLTAGCRNGGGETTVIRIAATPTPHAVILEVVAEILAEQDIRLEIIQFTDFVQPNLVLQDGEVDANYFQHILYLEGFNVDWGTTIVPVASIHYEPFGIYRGRTASLEELTSGSQIAIPNDPTNSARALNLLEYLGLITLREGAGVTASSIDIVENPLGLNIIEMEAAQLPRVLQDVDMAVINGNFALGAGLSVHYDAVATEPQTDLVLSSYVNVIAVVEGNENNPAILALIEAIQSPRVRDFINDTFEGAVIPLF